MGTIGANMGDFLLTVIFKFYSNTRELSYNILNISAR